jgi:SAM-dependent methyltransferase
VEKSDRYYHVASHCICCGSADLQRCPAVLMPFIAHRIYQWEPALIDDSWGLKTIPKGMAYSLCNSLLCNQCGLLFLDIRFSDSELALLYQNYRDEAYTALREHYEPGYRARNEGLVQGINYLQEVEDFLQPYVQDTLRVLDWGGDTGVNTPFKTNDANTVDIYDISGIETTGQVRKVSKETASQNHYDLIVCSNVLEHVPYPRRMLAEIKATMKQTTVLYIEVPLENLVKEHFGSTQLLGNKRHWHEHINFFSQQSLQYLVARHGLKVLAINEHPVTNAGKSGFVYMLACTLEKD